MQYVSRIPLEGKLSMKSTDEVEMDQHAVAVILFQNINVPMDTSS